MKQHIIETLAERYPQLTLPIAAETRHSEEYKDVVLRGVKNETSVFVSPNRDL